MEPSYIITFVGDDRPGLVEQLSQVIETNKANWHESRLSQLGGKFAGLILVSLPEGDAQTLESDLRALSSSGLSVRVTACNDIPVPVEGRKVTLTVVGPDRPGIVKEVASALARHQINVVEMESQVASAPMSGEMLFSATIEAQIPDGSNMDSLVDSLDEIANQMTLDIDLD